MKIDIEEVAHILSQHKLDAQQVKVILKDCEEVVEELKANKTPTKKSKWENVIVLHDKNNILEGKEIAGWVVQQLDGSDANTILQTLQSTAVEQNEAAKRKRTVIENFVDLFESLKPKFLKAKQLKIKTKELSRVIVTNGEFKK